ncbi:MAG TPA: hypothetical protein VMI11_01425 [Actinomycetes bacterium]|nr:hypothetical protein [Actinomycetes bacterium]
MSDKKITPSNPEMAPSPSLEAETPETTRKTQRRRLSLRKRIASRKRISLRRR